MIVTEKEARLKVCPYRSDPRGRGNCLASDCMKWRWMPRKSPKELEERKQWPLIPNTNEEEPTGYCG